MRRDVLDLRQCYASDLGRAARAMVGRKVIETWGDARGLDVLALGGFLIVKDGKGAQARG